MLELEKSKTNKEVAQLFGVPANTISTWKKNKDKIFEAFQEGSATTKRVKVDTYGQVNKAALKWFKRLRSENVSVNGFLIKEKALYFAQELTFKNFQASDRWLVGLMEEKVGFNLFLFQTLLLYNYSNLGSLSLRISMNFSSAINNN